MGRSIFKILVLAVFLGVGPDHAAGQTPAADLDTGAECGSQTDQTST